LGLLSQQADFEALSALILGHLVKVLLGKSL